MSTHILSCSYPSYTFLLSRAQTQRLGSPSLPQISRTSSDTETLVSYPKKQTPGTYLRGQSPAERESHVEHEEEHDENDTEDEESWHIRDRNLSRKKLITSLQSLAVSWETFTHDLHLYTTSLQSSTSILPSTSYSPSPRKPQYNPRNPQETARTNEDFETVRTAESGGSQRHRRVGKDGCGGMGVLSVRAQEQERHVHLLRALESERGNDDDGKCEGENRRESEGR